jgi:hypothetical protein
MRPQNGPRPIIDRPTETNADSGQIRPTDAGYRKKFRHTTAYLCSNSRSSGLRLNNIPPKVHNLSVAFSEPDL